MPRVESSVVIDAPRDVVLQVASKAEDFPSFMEDVRSVDIKERSDDGRRVVTEWVAIVPKFGNTIRWTEEDIWDRDAGTCLFRQLTGDYKQWEGEWRFTPEGENKTRFSSVVDYEIEIPLVGPLIKSIIKKAVQNNTDATLNAIKSRCEAQK